MNGDFPHGAQRICLILQRIGDIVPAAHVRITNRHESARLVDHVGTREFALLARILEQAIDQRFDGVGAHRRKFIDGFEPDLLVGIVERTHPILHVLRRGRLAACNTRRPAHPIPDVGPGLAVVVPAKARRRRPPIHIAPVPTPPDRIPRAQEYELDHVAARIGPVAERGVSDVESDQQARARLDLIADKREREIALSEVGLNMRARNDPRGTALRRSVLWKVEDHGQPGHVIARPRHGNLPILVPATVSR